MSNQIRITEKLNKEVKSIIEDIRVAPSPMTVEGIDELYYSLYINGYCTSYNLSRIYYVAYTLASEHVEFEIV